MRSGPRREDILALTLHALQFAAWKHRYQPRKGAKESAYINHPIALANVLHLEAGIDDGVVLAAALLHDTIEGTETTWQELRGEFGDEIANVVLERALRARPAVCINSFLTKHLEKTFYWKVECEGLRMAEPRRWSREELLVVLNLYEKLRFGQFHSRQPVVVEVAEKMQRTLGSLAMKLSNLASHDPNLQARGIAGLKGASNLDKAVWAW